MDVSGYFARPVPPAHRKWWALLALTALLLWATAAYVHLHFLSTPTLDGWCYFAPAAFATFPPALFSPLLGSFAGLDAAWGMHWPGVVALQTVLLAPLPASSALHVLYFIGLWAALALLAGWLAFRLSGNGWAGWVVAAVVLTDRAAFAIAFEMRPELATALAMLLTLALLIHSGDLGRRGWFGFYLLCFLLPTLHPMGVIFCGALGLVLGALAIRGEWSWGRYVVMAVCMAGGALGAVAYIVLQPAAWAQFKDHAAFNTVPFSWGYTFWLHLKASYAPLYAGFATYVLALAGAGYFLLRQGPARQRQEARWLAPVASLFLISLLVAQVFHNKDYVTTLLPIALLLAAVLVVTILRHLGGWPRLGVAVAVLALVALNAAYWPARTLNYVPYGLPDLRSEIVRFYDGLPEAPRVGVPIKLWQAAAIHPRPGVLLTTLPHHATTPRREAYERFVGKQLRAGDLLVIDHRYGIQPTYYLPEGLLLEPIDRLDRVLTFRGGKQGGFDLVAYRLVAAAEASPEAIAPPDPGRRRAPASISEVYD
ncbi:MAG: hypothetical protein AAGK14_03900 [Verrucomicrobiota bacterium]